jgi:stress response protein YsnF
MLDEREVSAAIGTTAYDANGQKIGTVEHFYVDDRTGAPSWVAVTTGLFGTRQSVVPALEATFADGGLRLPVAVDAVKSAPHLTGDHLTPDDEAELRRHYGTGVRADDLRADDLRNEDPRDQDLRDQDLRDRELRDRELRGGLQAGAPVAPAVAAAPTVEMPAVETPPPPAADRDHDGAMTRSEEQLIVGTERVATTRARLVKYVVTEEVQITVPVRREEIRIEQVPIDAPDDGPGETLLDDRTAGTPVSGTAGTGGLPDEIILHTERPVVTVEVVPTERVRLRTELVQGQETVTGQVQREQIVVDQDTAPGLSPR